MTSYRLIGGHSHLKLSRHFIGSSHSERFRKLSHNLVNMKLLRWNYTELSNPFIVS